MNADQPEGVALIARLATGDRDAAAELYDRHAGQVYALARRIVRNDADAEDIVQEVFLQAWRTAARYERGRGTVIGWLLLMTRTRSIDKLRARQSRPQTDGQVLPDSIQGTEAAPVDVLAAAQDATRVREALRSLSEQQRTALELAYFEGLTQSEVAAKLSEPLGTIKTRMRTALSTLRTRLRT